MPVGAGHAVLLPRLAAAGAQAISQVPALQQFSVRYAISLFMLA